MIRARFIQRSAIAVGMLLIASALSSCGDDEKSGVYDLEPGEECISGGVRIVKGGESSVVCFGDPDVAVDHVNSGQAGNPCAGSAIRRTDRTSGSEVVTWSCETQGVPGLRANETVAAEVAADHIQALLSFNVARSFLCSTELTATASREELDETIEWAAQLYQFSVPCLGIEMSKIDELSPLVQAHVDCKLAEVQADSACQLRVIARDIVADDPANCRSRLDNDLFECQVDSGVPSECLSLEPLGGDDANEFQRIEELIDDAITECRPF